MQSIQSIHVVTGPKLTIDLPAAFQGIEVNVVVTPVEGKPETAEGILARKLRSLIMEKPTVSAELRKRLTENPDLLRQSTPSYDDPFGPACPPEDWEVNE